MKGSLDNLRKVIEMKKRIVMFFAAVMATVCAQADTWTDPDTGHMWTYWIDGNTVEIYKSNCSAAAFPKLTGALAMPSTLVGSKVTSVRELAF